MKTMMFAGFFESNWQWMVAFVVMALIVFALLFFLGKARDASAEQLDYLYRTDINTYVERLENNKRLNLVFRKSIILLYKLDGYMAIDDNDKIQAVIAQLDKMNLEPNDRVEYYQKRLSYFVSVGNNDEVLNTREMLRSYLFKVKAQNTPKYKAILDEADTIVKVYVERDVSFIDSLVVKAQRTQQSVMRGVIQYRIAKLAYFKGDMEMMKKYLSRAETNLKGTLYQPIVESAIKDNSVLDKK